MGVTRDSLADLKFNPLEDGELDDRPPAVWNGPHVGRRIADAFEALASIPSHMARKSGLWPAYPYEFEDLLAQQEAEQRTPTSRRMQPTLEQITRMEAALCWPAHYLAKEPPLSMVAVNALARERARGGDASTLTRRRALPFIGGTSTARQWQILHDDGCDVIARGLIRDRVRVF
jgi:hypothetical protein